jgi:hypothetical protein
MALAQYGSVLETGADALDIVEGITQKNVGLRLQLKQPQQKFENGWLRGRFEVLAEGNGTYSEQIRPLVGQTMNAAEFIEAVLSASGSAKSRLTVLDRNSLRVSHN